MKDEQIGSADVGAGAAASGVSESEQNLKARTEVAGENHNAERTGLSSDAAAAGESEQNLEPTSGVAGKGQNTELADMPVHGKKKIDAYLKAIQDRGDNLFVPYIVAGDGGMDRLQEQIKLLEESGVAAIELGIPFSDPVADGPTIQRAGMRALEAGVTLRRVLDMLLETRAERTVPIVLMTYFNPIFSYGVAEFAAACVESGVDGLIVPDVPMEEEDLLAAELGKNGVAFIRLVALTSTPERMEALAERSEGFLYAVAVRGTTGARASHDDQVSVYLEKLQKMSDVPVLAGFGVSNAAQARELSSHCAGVIVGSAIVDLFYEGRDDEVQALVKDSL